MAKPDSLWKGRGDDYCSGSDGHVSLWGGRGSGDCSGGGGGGGWSYIADIKLDFARNRVYNWIGYMVDWYVNDTGDARPNILFPEGLKLMGVYYDAGYPYILSVAFNRKPIGAQWAGMITLNGHTAELRDAGGLVLATSYNAIPLSALPKAGDTDIDCRIELFPL